MKLPPPRPDPLWTSVREHDIEELWDHSRAPHVAAAYAARMELLTRLALDAAGPRGRVLDVGCAQGTLGLRLAARGLRVTLLDVRPEFIEYARARQGEGEIQYCVGHLGPDCPPEGDFDLVICTEVLEHVPAPGEFLRLLRDKTRPGGAVLLTTPNADYLLSRLPSYGRAAQAVVDATPADSADGDAHRYAFSREEMVALVRGAGLKVERTGFFLPFWLQGHLKTRYIHQLLYSFFRRLPALPRVCFHSAARYLCSSLWAVATRHVA